MNPRNGHRGWQRREQLRNEAAAQWHQQFPEGKMSDQTVQEVPVTPTPRPWWHFGLSGCGLLALIVLCLLLAALVVWNPLGIHGIQISRPAVVAEVPTQAPAYVAPTSVVEAPAIAPEANSHGQPPQPQIGHPSYYVETGVQDKEFTWTLNVAEGEMAIAGGTSVNGISGGTYVGFGPGTHKVTVINGFALITKAEWAKAEWDFRIQQTVTYGWAHANLDPGPIK